MGCSGGQLRAVEGSGSCDYINVVLSATELYCERNKTHRGAAIVRQTLLGKGGGPSVLMAASLGPKAS